MAELAVAESMFARKFKLRKGAPWRIALGAILCMGAAFAIPIVAFNTFYGSLMFLALFAVSLGAMALIYDEPFKNILCCAIAGFTVQHIAQELYEIFGSALRATGVAAFDFYGSGSAFGSTETIVFMLVYFQIFFLIYSAAYWLFCAKIEQLGIFGMNNFTVILIAVLFVFINVVFGAVIIWSLPEKTDAASVCMLHVYGILCCVLALIMLFELPRRKRVETELAAVKQINHMQSEQYRISKENVELINLKCHDLKHHIRRFKHIGNVSGKELAELEKVVDIYDSAYRTGNEALDVILMEKSLVCKNENINLSCIIDASQIKFISDADVYVLFGNLLDNAIEAVRALPESERSIGVSIKRVNDFSAIHVYNGYAGDLKFENGLPVTNKQQKSFHGYGLKSVKRTVENYDGILQINAAGGIFNVKILFTLE